MTASYFTHGKVFGPTLRSLGFKREWRMKDCVQYIETREDRFLHVQLWIDGNHRVSCALRTKYGEHGFTHPTSFTNIREMKNAIEIERARDLSNRPGDGPISHHSE